MNEHASTKSWSFQAFSVVTDPNTCIGIMLGFIPHKAIFAWHEFLSSLAQLEFKECWCSCIWFKHWASTLNLIRCWWIRTRPEKALPCSTIDPIQHWPLLLGAEGCCNSNVCQVITNYTVFSHQILLYSFITVFSPRDAWRCLKGAIQCILYCAIFSRNDNDSHRFWRPIDNDEEVDQVGWLPVILTEFSYSVDALHHLPQYMLPICFRKLWLKCVHESSISQDISSLSSGSVVPHCLMGSFVKGWTEKR